VRAKMVRKPWEYEWSSAAVHVDDRSRSELLDLSDWYKQTTASQWRELLTEKVEDKNLSSIRGNTYTGRPLGSDSFVSKLEKLAGRRLRPLPVGRPKKVRKKRRLNVKMDSENR